MINQRSPHISILTLLATLLTLALPGCKLPSSASTKNTKKGHESSCSSELLWKRNAKEAYEFLNSMNQDLRKNPRVFGFELDGQPYLAHWVLLSHLEFDSHQAMQKQGTRRGVLILRFSQDAKQTGLITPSSDGKWAPVFKNKLANLKKWGQLGSKDPVPFHLIGPDQKKFSIPAHFIQIKRTKVKNSPDNPGRPTHHFSLHFHLIDPVFTY